MAAPGTREALDPRWIIVADGDEASGNLLADLLRVRGFWAYPTTLGAEALRVARTLRLALAVVDVALRDMDGNDLAACLRGIDSRLPVVMTSADPRPDVEVRARQVGIVHYAHKPLDHRLLEAIVAQVGKVRYQVLNATGRKRLPHA